MWMKYPCTCQPVSENEDTAPFFLKKRLFLTFLQLFEISGEIKKIFLSFFFSFLNFRAIEFKTIDLLSLTFYYEISLKEIFR